MKEQLISFETAKLAKKKGFSGICPNWFNNAGVEQGLVDTVAMENLETVIYRPTQSLLQKWLWDTHTIWVGVQPLLTPNECIGIRVFVSAWKFPLTILEYDGFDVYEGFEVGLKGGLEYVH